MATSALSVLRTRIGELIELDSSTIADALTLYVNLAGRRIWNAHPWPERRIDTVLSTVVPYATGTVALTNAATTCVGTGTTFPTTSTGRKIATAYGSPWYRVTYVGATSLTLGRNYLETTATAAAYVLYQDEYDLTSSWNQIEGVYLILDRARGRLRPLTKVMLDASTFNPSIAAAPESWSPTTETTAGTPRIRLNPIPDATYGVVVTGLKTWTVLSGDSDVAAVHEDREELLIYGACLWAQRLANAKHIVSEETFLRMMSDAWNVAQRRKHGVVYRQPFDAGSYAEGNVVDISNL